VAIAIAKAAARSLGKWFFAVMVLPPFSSSFRW
jgi:hypothetical protein